MKTNKGAYIGLLIIALWFASVSLLLHLPIDWYSPWPYLAMLFQTHLYTGLFITAHDSMHANPLKCLAQSNTQSHGLHEDVSSPVHSDTT